MQEKGFLFENKRVRSFRVKFEPRFFKNARLALGFPFSPSAKKKVFEVKRDLKNLLCQATEHWRLK